MKTLAIYAPFYVLDHGRESPLITGPGPAYVFEPAVLALPELQQLTAIGLKIAERGGVAVLVAAGTDKALLASTLHELASEFESGYMPDPSVGDVARWHMEYGS